MADDRVGEAVAAEGLARAGAFEASRLAGTLAAAAQRMRLLVNGVAGPLSDRQRTLALDVLRDLDQICDVAGAAAAGAHVEPEPFGLGALAADVVGAYRFVAHRKQLALTLAGATGHTDAHADVAVTRGVLADAVGAAVAAAPGGSRVSVEIARTVERLAIDVSAPGWDPRLPPAPPVGSGVAVSVLRTASGARLVLTVPAAL